MGGFYMVKFSGMGENGFIEMGMTMSSFVDVDEFYEHTALTRLVIFSSLVGFRRRVVRGRSRVSGVIHGEGTVLGRSLRDMTRVERFPLGLHSTNRRGFPPRSPPRRNPPRRRHPAPEVCGQVPVGGSVKDMQS